jgi:hypothetical protein
LERLVAYQNIQRQKDVAKAMHRPEPFMGTVKDKNNRAMEIWLDEMSDYLNITTPNDDELKINVATSFFQGTARKEYRDKIKDGKFRTYDELCKWLLSHYAPSDPVNAVRDRFVSCIQGSNESFDAYFERFRNARNLLDEPLSESWTIFFFVNGLLPPFRVLIRGDMNFSDYKDLTLDMVLSKLKRVHPSNIVRSQPDFGTKRPFVAGQQVPDKRQKSNPTTSKPNPTTTVVDATPLTDGERKFLELNVQKGGGRYIRESVQRKEEWVRRARAEGLCIKCAGKGHYIGDCKVTRSEYIPARFNQQQLLPNEELEQLNLEHQV